MARVKATPDYVEFESFDVEAETPKALCINWRSRQIWFPKSQVRLTACAEGLYAGSPILLVPRWLAAQNRMLY